MPIAGCLLLAIADLLVACGHSPHNRPDRDYNPTSKTTSTLLSTTVTTNFLPPPLPPDTSLTTSPILSLTSSTPTIQSQLTNFINTHLKNNLTPNHLLLFLKNHLHHHPKFAHLDLHVFRHAATLDSFCHDHSTHEWMVRTLAITHRLDSLSSVLDFIVSNPCPCSDGIFFCTRTEPIFRFAITSFCNVGRLDDALQVFDKMRKLVDGKPNVAIYNTMIHSFVKYRKFEKGLEFYGRMIKDRVRPDVITFNIFINGYFRNSKFELALEVFKEMRVKGCVPNVVTFNTLIKVFFRERKFKEGIGMAYEMIELRCGLSSTLCDQGNVVKARLMVDEIWDKGNAPSSITCTILIEGLRRIKDIELALKLMDKMLQQSIVPDSVTFNFLLDDLYNILISGYSKEKRKKEGKAIVDEMLDKDFIHDIATYNRLMKDFGFGSLFSCLLSLTVIPSSLQLLTLATQMVVISPVLSLVSSL
ncbi:hypothetical protein L1987_30312 [Smallanthus sonchifolius]|uniref:Uncharacterized protein n=1 Tax=Smallanthus sonchifolius TaxID=185202 RepID=A0ACB9I541_9ASTR|nr:hypothetical protein L1987_30312 [Smallanthus sonchifolius]